MRPVETRAELADSPAGRADRNERALAAERVRERRVCCKGRLREQLGEAAREDRVVQHRLDRVGRLGLESTESEAGPEVESEPESEPELEPEPEAEAERET